MEKKAGVLNFKKSTTTTKRGGVWPASVVADVKASFSRILAMGRPYSGLKPDPARAFSAPPGRVTHIQ